MPRILSLDGGGVWALIQAQALARLYGDDTPGSAILAEFDGVVASGTGALVAAGLAENLSPAEIGTFFTDGEKRKLIFPRRRGIAWRSRWRTSAKLDGLLTLLAKSGRCRLTELPGRLLELNPQLKRAPQFVFVACDRDRRAPVFFRSDPLAAAGDANGRAAAQPFLAEAVHAATTTPLRFFDVAAQFTASGAMPGRHYWDAAWVGLANPVQVAVVEALASGGRDASVEVLSLGTGSVGFPATDASGAPGSEWAFAAPAPAKRAAGDVAHTMESLFDDPPDVATFMAHVTAGGTVPLAPEWQPVRHGPIVRMNPLIQPRKPLALPSGAWLAPVIEVPATLPGSTAGASAEELLARLARIDVDATDDADVALIEAFGRAWLNEEVTNQPIRAGGSLELQIGQHSFHEAWTAWRELAGGDSRTLLRVPPRPYPQASTGLSHDTTLFHDSPERQSALLRPAAWEGLAGRASVS